ncbi:MAG: hypothetical protein SGJ18_14625 [Pseudomonadota bacterium]|nr:hypothetical protein [Pseudomonadota bacterium]
MIWILPVIVQGILMAVDEFYFHRRRGLPKWEIWGHPVDTLSVLLCLTLIILFPQMTWQYYLVPATVSCLCVTKDEWVHSELCEPFEGWIHSLLFIIHPLVLWSFFELAKAHISFLFYLLLGLLVFLIYQIVFWGFLRKNEIKSN